MHIRVVEGPTCPRCGGVEVLLGGPVRPFKVDAGRGGWESNCTDCRIWFLPNGTVTEEEKPTLTTPASSDTVRP